PETDRMLATVMFTDIVGSTQRAVEIGDSRWRELRDDWYSALRKELATFRGREVDTTRDGLLATFDGPARAIRCACSIREHVKTLDLQVRTGLHTGECELVDDKCWAWRYTSALALPPSRSRTKCLFRVRSRT